MKPQPNNDQNLIIFLKQNQPIYHNYNPYQEEQLMKIISSGNLRSSCPKNKYFWAVPSAIAVGFLLLFGNLTRANFYPQIANQKEDLEEFMVNSWRGSMSEKIGNSHIDNLEENWLLLTEYNVIYSNP